MRWHRYPTLGGLGAMRRVPIPSSRYMSDDPSGFTVYPRYATGRGGRRLKSIVWHLTENGRMIGRPFNSARLAKAFAEEYATLAGRARAEFVRDGAGWCYDKENEWRHEREQRWREKNL